MARFQSNAQNLEEAGFKFQSSSARNSSEMDDGSEQMPL